MKNYSYAILYYAMKEFDKALTIASKVSLHTFNIRYDLMLLRVKCYYELNLVEEMYYQLDSFKHLLKKDSSPEWAKKRFENFVIYFERLLKFVQNKDAEGMEFLKKELIKDREVSESGWLTEKINLMLNIN
jgi:hypothetical protein